MNQRIFTLAQARAVLPQIRPLVEELRRAHRRQRELEALGQSLARSSGGDGHGALPSPAVVAETMRRETAAVREMVERIAALGAEVKDLDRGLIDWVALREGREVYLCWQCGEDDVRWWHEIRAGFAGREPIDPGDWE